MKVENGSSKLELVLLGKGVQGSGDALKILFVSRGGIGIGIGVLRFDVVIDNGGALANPDDLDTRWVDAEQRGQAIDEERRPNIFIEFIDTDIKSRGQLDGIQLFNLDFTTRGGRHRPDYRLIGGEVVEVSA